MIGRHEAITWAVAITIAVLVLAVLVGKAIVVPADDYIEPNPGELYIEKVEEKVEDKNLGYAVIFVEVLLEGKYSAEGLIFTLKATKRTESVYQVRGQLEYGDANGVLTDEIDALVSMNGNLWKLETLRIDGRLIE